jgi:hypothetical protein
MAWQTAAMFLELLATNRNLQTHQQLADAWSISALTRFAAGKGFIFSEADLRVALESFTRQRVARQ